MTRLHVLNLLSLCFMAFACGCGGSANPAGIGEGVVPTGQDPAAQGAATNWPAGLPVDRRQPWEGQPGDSRTASVQGLADMFTAGYKRFSNSANASEAGEALRLDSGAAGSGVVSWACFRLVLNGRQPGVVSADFNLAPGTGSGDGYYLGLSDYSGGGWEWCGPFTDNHIRISTGRAVAGGRDYLSDLGNLFVCVVAHDGVAGNLIGVSAGPVDAADSTAPAAPTGLSAEPLTGALDLEWDESPETDIAGYRVFYANNSFTSPEDAGVQYLDYLVAATNHILAGVSGQVYVRVAAVDVSGNESSLGGEVSATPLAGELLKLDIAFSQASALVGEIVTMTVSGAVTYDWDIDGDGTFEILSDASGTQPADTGDTGIIRPTVRGYDGEGSCMACGSGSLLVDYNSRPVACGEADPAYGPAPLLVNFTGDESTDFDGDVVGGGWDFDGDGIYDVWDDNDTTHVDSASHTYTSPGTYNAKLRVVDEEGAWDLDTLAVVVGDSVNAAPVADIQADTTSGDAPLTVQFDASGSTDGDGSIVEYSWDFDGDAIFDGTSYVAIVSHTYTEAGSPRAMVRVVDDDGASDTAWVEITVNVSGNAAPVAALSANPTSGDAPLAVSLDASASTDSDGTIVSYEWDFDGDGLYDAYSESATASHTYNTAGAYNTLVRVTDEDGAQDTAFETVTVSAPGTTSPTADLAVDPAYGDEGAIVTLDASGSSPAIGSIVSYEWDFDGDGLYDSYGAADTTQHAYHGHGVFDAMVRVTDDGGGQDTATATVRVNEVFHLYHQWGSRNHDIRNTRRSGYVGAQTNNLKWSYTDGSNNCSPMAIANDGTVYAGVDNNVYAFNPDGTVKWTFVTGDRVMWGAAIAADGTLYIGSRNDKIYAINPDGSLKWDYTMTGTINGSPVVAPDGTIYVPIHISLFAFNPDGTVKWSYSASEYMQYGAAIGHNGTVYTGSNDDNLYALNPDGSLKWSYDVGGDIGTAPAIGPDGTLYFGCYNTDITALNPDGTLQWAYDTGGRVTSAPAIAADGTIYAGSYDHKVYALNPDGTQKWFYSTSWNIYSSPAVGADGTVYIGTSDDTFFAFNPDGTVKWSFATGDEVHGPVLIGVDGTVYTGCSDSYLYAFGVDEPISAPTAEFIAAPRAGLVPLSVSFDASGSSDSDGEIVSYEWDLNGDGIYDSYGTTATASHVYYEVENVNVKLRVTDNEGYHGTTTVTVYAVDPGDWVTFDADTDGQIGEHASLAVVNGNPAISYHSHTNNDLMFVRATDVNGTNWGTPVAVDTGDPGAYHHSIAIVDGNPAISYHYYTSNELKFVRAADANGTTWNSPVVVDTDGDVGKYSSLAIVDGVPAISYFQWWPAYNLKYVRASNVTGSAWGTPVDVVSTQVGENISLVVVDGNPALGYYESNIEDLMYVRSSDTSGATWGAPLTVDSTGAVGRYASMSVVDGNPAFSYYDTDNGDMTYVRALDATGGSWGPPLAVDATGDTGQYTSLVFIGGYPALSYYDVTNGDLRYVLGTNGEGSTWGTPVTLDSTGDTGQYTSLTIVNGNPAVGYYDNTNDSLRYARMF